MTWISVEDKRPEAQSFVKVKGHSISGDTTGSAFFNGFSFDCMMMSGGGPEGLNIVVTHWMPLKGAIKV
jgi:hypothetical protein